MSLSDGTTQVRGGTGLFTGKPPYVWISNQIGNTGVLTGFLDSRSHDRVSVQPESGQVQAGARPAVSAASYELDLTDQSFRFPQTWRTNIGVDRKLPWGLIGTVDYIYNSDRNAPVYINANLPAAESAYTRRRQPARAGSRRQRLPACITRARPDRSARA